MVGKKAFHELIEFVAFIITAWMQEACTLRYLKYSHAIIAASLFELQQVVSADIFIIKEAITTRKEVSAYACT